MVKTQHVRLSILIGSMLLTAAGPAPEPAAAAAAAAAIQSDGKATAIYNIIRFIGFPGRPLDRPLANLRVCARQGLLDRIMPIDGQPVGKGRIDVMPIDARAPAIPCDVIYLGAGSSAGLPAIPGQILIGDGIAFAQTGGTIGLIPAGERTRFAINARSAARANVHVSAQLMRLAVKIFN